MNNETQNLPKVTVIIPAYNIEKYIEKCVRSIMNQTYSNLEIVVVDDCSHDSTGKICDELAALDPRICVIHHPENRRIPSVRNTGLDRATGEYIAFVDGDDWLASDFVEYLYHIISTTNSDMAISCVNFTTRDMVQTERDSVEIWTPEQATSNFLFSKLSIGCWNKLYRRDFIEREHLRFKTDLFSGEGYRFISDCSQRVNQVAVGHRKVYYYRLNNPNSATTLPDIRQGLGCLYTLEGVERDLLIRTEPVMTSWYHHVWLNQLYTLQILIETGTVGENLELYHRCIRNARKYGLIFAVKYRKKYSLRVLLKSAIPVTASKYAIKKKNEAFRRDVTE